MNFPAIGNSGYNDTPMRLLFTRAAMQGEGDLDSMSAGSSGERDGEILDVSNSEPPLPGGSEMQRGMNSHLNESVAGQTPQPSPRPSQSRQREGSMYYEGTTEVETLTPEELQELFKPIRNAIGNLSDIVNENTEGDFQKVAALRDNSTIPCLGQQRDQIRDCLNGNSQESHGDWDRMDPLNLRRLESLLTKAIEAIQSVAETMQGVAKVVDVLQKSFEREMRRSQNPSKDGRDQRSRSCAV